MPNCRSGHRLVLAARCGSVRRPRLNRSPSHRGLDQPDGRGVVAQLLQQVAGLRVNGKRRTVKSDRNRSLSQSPRSSENNMLWAGKEKKEWHLQWPTRPARTGKGKNVTYKLGTRRAEGKERAPVDLLARRVVGTLRPALATFRPPAAVRGIPPALLPQHPGAIGVRVVGRDSGLSGPDGGVRPLFADLLVLVALKT